jgi:hypothetical protein
MDPLPEPATDVEVSLATEAKASINEANIQ